MNSDFPHKWSPASQTFNNYFYLFLYLFLFYSITLEGRRNTTDEFATIPFHLVLFSAALVELAKSIAVHSLILSSHLFFCLSFFLFPFPVWLSLLNQETLKHGQTISAFVSWPGSGVRHVLQVHHIPTLYPVTIKMKLHLWKIGPSVSFSKEKFYWVYF